MCIKVDNVQMPNGNGTWKKGALYIKDGRFSEPRPADEIVDGGGMLAIPGLIDIHTHGRKGADFCTATVEELHMMARDYALCGVTTVLPTFASATEEEWKTALTRLGEAKEPSYLGVHFEGRWLSPNRRGAHALSLLTPPNPAELERYLAMSPIPILRVSAAPELDENGAFLAACRKHGIHFVIGHTDADYQTAMRALDEGADAFTHLYNAMPPLHHRAGGPVAAALTEPRAYAELICDGLHIAPEMVRLTYQAKGTEKLILISDSMAGTGCPDGEYDIAGQTAVLKNGRALTPDGKLAGSTLNLLKGVQNLAKFAGIPFGKALLTATATPAAYLHMEKELGTLASGAVANLLLMESETAEKPARVMMGGKWL